MSQKRGRTYGTLLVCAKTKSEVHWVAVKELSLSYHNVETIAIQFREVAGAPDERFLKTSHSLVFLVKLRATPCRSWICVFRVVHDEAHPL